MFSYEKYYPITATPFRRNKHYIEIAPCDALKPYIRCFWGSSRPEKCVPASRLITPDTCVDIIFKVNYTQNKIDNVFCGVNDTAFQSLDTIDAGGNVVATFAIRFYAWSAVLFSEESMKGTKNQVQDIGVRFEKLKRELEPKLFAIRDMKEWQALAEAYLLKHCYVNHENSLFRRVMVEIIEKRGNRKVLELATDFHVSSRQIERIFYENMGVSPKKAATLIRYQSLWQDICFQPSFNVLDAVCKYGYTDQAHLLNDFRRFHGLSIRDAITYSRAGK